MSSYYIHRYRITLQANQEEAHLIKPREERFNVLSEDKDGLSNQEIFRELLDKRILDLGDVTLGGLRRYEYVKISIEHITSSELTDEDLGTVHQERFLINRLKEPIKRKSRM